MHFPFKNLISTSQLKSLLVSVGVGAFLMFSAQAKEIPMDTPLPDNFVPNIEEGQKLAQICSACHGALGDGILREKDGTPRMKDGKPLELGDNYPSLAGQHASYTIAQLRAFQMTYMDPERAKKNNLYRADVSMQPYVTAPMVGGKIIDSESAAHIAAFFEAQKPRSASEPTKPSTEFEERIDYLYKGGDLARNIPSCASCHSPTGQGNGPAVYPHLAGQHAKYTEKQLHDFKNSRDEDAPRYNDNERMMRDIAERLSDSEIKGLAHYIENMDTPKITIQDTRK